MLTAADYTDYSAVTTALALPETTNTEIVAKTTAINTAIAGLVFAGQAALDAAITAEGLLTAADYTDYSAVTTALALPETTNTEIVAKTTAINTAIAGLVFAGQAALDTAKTAESALLSTDYVDYSAVTTALALPETTNAEVVTKTTAINTAIAGLVPVGVDAALQAAKDAEAALTSTDYVDYSAVTTALALPETTNTEIVAKTTAINTAIAGLVFAGQASLDTAKTAESALLSTDYVDYSAVTTALALPETTNTEIVAKTTAINTAIAGLVFAGQAALDTAKTAESALLSTDYVDYSAVTTALALPETTNTEIVAKTTAINTAIAGLVFAGQAALDTAKTAESALLSTDYVDYSAVTTALALPETTNAEIVAKTTAINNAIAGLITANLSEISASVASGGTFKQFMSTTNAVINITEVDINANPVANPNLSAVVVKNGATVLTLTTHYTVDDTANTITIKQSYLDTLLSVDSPVTITIEKTAGGLSDTVTLIVNPRVSGDDRNVSSITGNNILLVGDYAFTLDPTNVEYNLNNFIIAAQTAYTTDAGVTYKVYFKVGTSWYDINNDPNMLTALNVTTINSDGLFKYLDMQ